MNKQTERHLTESQIIVATISEEDLDDAARGHLQSCVHCSRAFERLGRDLSLFGATARELAPTAPRFRVVARERERARRKPVWSWGFGAAAVMALAVVIMLFTGPLDGNKPDVAMLNAPAAQDEILLAEVDHLIEYPLPASMRHIAVEDDSDDEEYDMDSDFMRFMAPSVESARPVSETNSGGLNYA